MMVYVVQRWSVYGEEDPEILGVYSSAGRAKHTAITVDDWDPDSSEPDDLLWGNESYAVQVIEKEID